MYQPVALPKAAVMHIGQVVSWQARVSDVAGAEQSGVILLALGAALAGTTMVLILFVRQLDQVDRDSTRTVYRLEFPRDLVLDQVVAFVRSLVGLRPPRWSLLARSSIAFEVVAQEGISEHRLRVPRNQVDRVLAQLRSTIPGVRTVLVEDAALPQMQLVREVALSSPDLPIRTDQAAGFAASLLHALQPLSAAGGEMVVFQVVVYPVGTPTGVPTPPSTEVKMGPGWLKTASRVVLSSTAPGQQDKKALRAKVSEPVFGVVGRVGARSAARGRSGHLVGRIVGILHQLDQPGVRFTGRPVGGGQAAARLARAATPISVAPVRANAREVATLIGWPLDGPTVPGLRLTGGRVLPPAPELPSTGRVVGRAVYSGMERDIGLSIEAALHHLLVSGPTGSGKSTLLLNLIAQDIRVGHGLILVDPGGDLARDAIDRVTPERTGDLIFVNPADSRVVGLNPLAVAPDDAELVADQLLELIRERADSWGPVIEETLKATLVLLAATPGMTLVEIPAVLLDPGFRRRLVSGLDPAFGPTVGEFFARFESLSPGQQAMSASAVLNKVSPFLDRRPIRAMLGQAEPTWTMRQVIDRGKILVVSLPSGVIGPVAADLIGSVIVTMAWNAVMGRQSLRREHRRPVSLVIDELPRFVRGGTSLTDILARARGHGLGLVGAVQHIGQVRPDLRAALLSEARNKIILQPAADDAALFARHLPGVRPEDLLTLEPRTAIAALVVGGRVAAPVTIATLPPPEPTGQGNPARDTSRERYGRDRDEVDQAIAERRQGPEPGSPRRTRRLPQ